MRTFAADLDEHVDQRVEVAGWLHHRRSLGRVGFVLLRDRSGIAQVVVSTEEERAAVQGLASESVLKIAGTVVRNEQAPAGVELVDPAITVISRAEAAPPIELRRPTLDEQLPTRLDHASIALRHPRRQGVARLAAASVAGFRAALDELDFTEIHTPKVVPIATESGANVFPIDWFGRPAYLAQSPQLYKQIMVGVLERVYEVGPVFRAEPHDTARHLAEYTSLDAEMGFIDDHRDVMDTLHRVLAAMAEHVRSCGERLSPAVEFDVPAVPSDIPTLDFHHAQEIIQAATGHHILGEPDLSPADERWLSEWAERETGSEFLFVTGYPMAKRPFYTHPAPTEPDASNSFDLLFRGLELVTGGQRLHRPEDYRDALGEHAVELEPYQEAFRHGMPPHGGFAIGLERWISQVTGARNVREASLFPRDMNRLTP